MSCCVVFTLAVVDYVCFMLCSFYNAGSGLYLCHAVLYLQ